MVKRRTKKAIGIVIGIIAALVLLIPVPLYADDGGTVRYQAVLYSVTNYHSMRADDLFLTGIEIKILGMTVYNNTVIE